MNIVTLDFETYWTKDYTLTKLSSIEYINDPRFEAISGAIKIGNGQTTVVFGEDQIRERLKSINWRTHAAVAHNGNEFDFPILVWKFDCHPSLFIDTAALWRPKHQSVGGVSLKTLSQAHGLKEKNGTILINTQGKRYVDLDLNEMRDMAVYNRDDVDNCYELLRRLRPWTPEYEFALSDMTARMFCYPQLEADTELLESTLAQVAVDKRAVLESVCEILGVVDIEDAKAQLMSQPKFAAVLRSLGVEPATKISKTTGRETLALAKSDQEFLALLEHPDPKVQAIAAARIDAKSTLLETRLQTMLACARAMNGAMPIPLAYHAATTGRWGGRVWNPQNLPRIPRDKAGEIIHKPTNALRMSLRAPKGYAVVVSDLSGIELRVNHYLWNVRSTQELYEQDPQADLYKEFAAALYGKDKADVTKDERQLAKVAQLGLGFGAGAKTFRKVAKLMGGVDLDEEESARVVAAWRAKYIDIVRGWKNCDRLVNAMYSAVTYSPDPRGLVETTAPFEVRLPSGRSLYYPNLRLQYNNDTDKQEMVYGFGKNTSKVYAGLMTENCVAEGTLVFTARGWLPIKDVSADDLVHDGVEFVQHAGLVYKSVQSCLHVNGVWMTPDHKVLTTDGWKEASQLQRPHGAAFWVPDSGWPEPFRRQEVAMDGEVRLRCADYWNADRVGQSSPSRTAAKLRVHDPRHHSQSAPNAWHDEAPGICGMAVNAGSLQITFAQGVEKLRRAWDRGVRPLAKIIRELLGGYGANILARVGVGPHQQRRPVFAAELPVDYAQSELQEQARRSFGKCARDIQAVRHQQVDAVLPTCERVPPRAAHNTAFAHKPVYDIMNCGPRHRFVVLGEDGPFVVHNCVQAIARDVIAYHALEIRRQTGYAPAHMVHDELVYVAPESEAPALLDEVNKIMRKPPSWLSGIVLYSEGDIAPCYGEAK